jgi:hypothetical protein
VHHDAMGGTGILIWLNAFDDRERVRLTPSKQGRVRVSNA